MVFEVDPDNEGDAEDEIKEAFIEDCKDDEDRGEDKKDNNEAVEVIVI